MEQIKNYDDWKTATPAWCEDASEVCLGCGDILTEGNSLVECEYCFDCVGGTWYYLNREHEFEEVGDE
ncbi:MAG: hypothetical protein ACE5EK_11270 [Nitrospinales bacterium]